LQAGLLAHPVPAAFPFHILCNSGGGCRNNYRIYSCGYSSRFPATVRFTGHGIPYSLRPERFRPEHL